MNPRTQEHWTRAIPVHRDKRAMVRVVAGRHVGMCGPVNDIVAEPTLLEVRPGGGMTLEADLLLRNRLRVSLRG